MMEDGCAKDIPLEKIGTFEGFKVERFERWKVLTYRKNLILWHFTNLVHHS